MTLQLEDKSISFQVFSCLCCSFFTTIAVSNCTESGIAWTCAKFLELPSSWSALYEASPKVSPKSAVIRYTLSSLADFCVHGPRTILPRSIALLISWGNFDSGDDKDCVGELVITVWENWGCGRHFWIYLKLVWITNILFSPLKQRQYKAQNIFRPKIKQIS